jgi:hypothetical protein
MSEDFVAFMTGTVPFQRWRICSVRFLLRFCASVVADVIFELSVWKWIDAGWFAFLTSALWYGFDKPVASTRRPSTNS